MGPIIENYYFDPSMNLPPGHAEKTQPIRPDPESAKQIAENMKKKEKRVSLMTGPDAARIGKRDKQKKEQNQQQKKFFEKRK